MCVLLVSLRLQSLQELREVVSIEETDQVLNGRSVRRRASTHENLTSTDLPDVYCYHVRAALRGLHLYNADNTGPKGQFVVQKVWRRLDLASRELLQTSVVIGSTDTHYRIGTTRVNTVEDECG